MQHDPHAHQNSGKTWSVCGRCGLVGPSHEIPIDDGGFWKTECPGIMDLGDSMLHMMIEPPRAEIVRRVLAERGRQMRLWGDQRRSNGSWMLVLMEEIGEASEEALNENWIEGPMNTKVTQELVQATAVLFAWLEDRLREDKEDV